MNVRGWKSLGIHISLGATVVPDWDTEVGSNRWIVPKLPTFYPD